MLMGRIKTTPVKRLSIELYEKHGTTFTEDFGKNKEVMKQYVQVPSTKVRNSIAGYITRLIRKRNRGEDVFARPTVAPTEKPGFGSKGFGGRGFGSKGFSGRGSGQKSSGGRGFFTKRL